MNRMTFLLTLPRRDRVILVHLFWLFSFYDYSRKLRGLDWLHFWILKMLGVRLAFDFRDRVAFVEFLLVFSFLGIFNYRRDVHVKLLQLTPADVPIYTYRLTRWLYLFFWGLNWYWLGFLNCLKPCGDCLFRRGTWEECVFVSIFNDFKHWINFALDVYHRNLAYLIRWCYRIEIITFVIFHYFNFIKSI